VRPAEYESGAVHRWLALCCGLLTVGLLLAPGDAVQELQTFVRGLFQLPVVAAVPGGTADKWVHGVLFTLWGCSLRLGWRRVPAYALFALLLMAGAVTETLQLRVPGRKASIADLAADLAGAASGLALAWALSWWRNADGRRSVRPEP